MDALQHVPGMPLVCLSLLLRAFSGRGGCLDDFIAAVLADCMRTRAYHECLHTGFHSNTAICDPPRNLRSSIPLPHGIEVLSCECFSLWILSSPNRCLAFVNRHVHTVRTNAGSGWHIRTMQDPRQNERSLNAGLFFLGS